MNPKSYDLITYTRLPELVKAELERLARQRGTTLAQLLREAAIFYLENGGNDRPFSLPIVSTSSDR